MGVKDCWDTFEIQTLLEAACIDSLDSRSFKFDGKNNTIRQSGVILLVSIGYYNYINKVSGPNTYHYYIKVNKVDDAQYYTDQVVYSGNLSELMIINRYGIRIIFLQEGEIGTFNLFNVLSRYSSYSGIIFGGCNLLAFIFFDKWKWLKAKFGKYKEKMQDNETDSGDVKSIPYYNSNTKKNSDFFEMESIQTDLTYVQRKR